MTMLKKFTAATIAAGALFAIATPAQAVITTFASFSPIGSTSNVRWVNNNAPNNGTGGTIMSTATGSSSVVAPRNVSFSFLLPSLVPFVTNVTAAFTLNATAASGNPATLNAGIIGQDGIGGSFSFLTTAPITIGSTTFATGSNLLTGTFGGTVIAGQRGGTSASFIGSTVAGDTLSYTSDFLSFISVNDSDFAISLSAVLPGINAIPSNGVPTRALRNFRAVAGGTFSTDPAPIVTAIPEPAVWGLMIVGFGMVGLQSRRRTRGTAVAA